MDALNLRVMVNLSGGSGDNLKQASTYPQQPAPGSVPVVRQRQSQRHRGPEWQAREVAALEQAIKDGAIGLKIFKNLGLTARKPTVPG